MINLKVRLKNPVFLAQLFLSFFLPILGYFGLAAEDITTWGVFFNVIGQAFANPFVLSLIVVSLWHAVNDPTTKGVMDSEQAQRYQWPR